MCRSLRGRLEHYFKKNPSVKTIVVAGSYGRLSAIRALTAILGRTLSVSVGINRRADLPDIVVLDYNSMSRFPRIQPDFTIIVSCVSDQEARSYFELANKSRYVVVNFNDVSQEYAKYLKNSNIITYGDELPADYYFENTGFSVKGCDGSFMGPDRRRLAAHLNLLGEHNLRPVTMAVAIAQLFHVPDAIILEAAESLRPLKGRLSVTRGVNGAVVIDDSADTSTLSVNLGLRAIYNLAAPSRILVLEKLDPGITIDKNLVSQVLVLDKNMPAMEKDIFHYFDNKLDLIVHLAKNMERDGIVLLEFPLPEIVDPHWDKQD